MVEMKKYDIRNVEFNRQISKQTGNWQSKSSINLKTWIGNIRKKVVIRINRDLRENNNQFNLCIIGVQEEQGRKNGW